GKIHFAVYIVGFNLLYFPMQLLYDMPRRIFTYDLGTGWGPINLLITIGAFTFGGSQLIMFANLLWSSRRGPAADRDPWGAYSLEWGVPSPPPEFNFPEGVPVISATGVTYRPVAMANGGHKEVHEAGSYEAESHVEHWSRWPIVVAAGAGIALWGVLMGLPALLFGTVVLAAAFTGWGRETLRGRFTEPIEAVGEEWPFERLENLPLGMWIFIFGEIAFFGTSTASSIYYVLTGVHGAHVVAGLVALIYLMVKAVKARSTTQASGAVEVFGIYWGMVDAVWIFLFPLLYLL